MIRTLVRHEQFGEGRIIALSDRQLTIKFIGQHGDDPDRTFSRDAFYQGVLTPVLLEKGRQCKGPQGACAVVRPIAGGPTVWRSYEVQYESGISSICSEVELEPVPSFSLPSPSSNLAVRQIHHLIEFRNREAFRLAHIQNLRQGGQLAAVAVRPD